MTTDSAAVPQVAGWYGKMPCLGDFASRRLSPGFISAWDEWLQHSIATSRRELGERWLDLFLKSPMWRFALAPGVCGESAWAGLLIPSVDRVGRYFPLTFALELQGRELTRAFAAQDWYAALENVAFSALNVDFSADELETALTGTPYPLNDVPASVDDAALAMNEWVQNPSGTPQALHFTSAQILGAAMDCVARAAYVMGAYAKSFWWSVDEAGATEAHCTAGLPPDGYFSVLLGASRTPGGDSVTSDPLKALGIENAIDGNELPI